MKKIECHCIKLPSGRVLACDACDSTIDFPAWVGKPTPCETRTFSIVLPKTDRYAGTRHGYARTRHGAIRIVAAFPNRPTVKLPRVGLPGFYTGWADEKC